MISLSSLAERFCSNDADGVVQLVAERCLRTRLNSNECRRCLEVCPGSALRVENRRILLDAERCSGCGRCRAVCPSDAFTSVVDITQLIDSLPGKDRTVISCSRQPRQTDKELVLPCLGLLSQPALLAIGSGGCTTVTFVTVGCAACSNAPAIDAFLTDLQHMAGLIKRCGGARLEILTAADQEPQPSSSSSRRSYLRDLKTSVRSRPDIPAPQSVVRTPARPSSGRQLPEKVALINRLLAGADDDSIRELRSSWFPRLSITSACTHCPRCAGICPTGALKRRGSGLNKQLVFNSSRCSGCRLCMEFCPQNAIILKTNEPERTISEQQPKTEEPFHC